MKSAEQWAEEWIGPDFNPESSLVELMKKIQSDAINSALTEAIDIHSHYRQREEHWQCRQALIALRDTKQHAKI